MIHIDYYRVGRWSTGKPKHFWSRTWQAEWVGCPYAPRAWTRRGIERKAVRWLGRQQNCGPSVPVLSRGDIDEFILGFVAVAAALAAIGLLVAAR